MVDDASDDSTPAVLAKNSDDRIVTIRHASRRGASAARNTGVRAARGLEWVAYLDDDDEWYPNHLLELAGHSPDKDMVYAASDYLGSAGKEPMKYASGWDPKRFIQDNFIPTIAAMHTLSVFDAVGGWREDLPCLNDYDLWVRIAEQKPRVAFVKKPTSLIHAGDGIHNDRLFGARTQTRRKIADSIRAKAKALFGHADVEPKRDAAKGCEQHPEPAGTISGTDHCQ